MFKISGLSNQSCYQTVAQARPNPSNFLQARPLFIRITGNLDFSTHQFQKPKDFPHFGVITTTFGFIRKIFADYHYFVVRELNLRYNFEEY